MTENETTSTTRPLSLATVEALEGRAVEWQSEATSEVAQQYVEKGLLEVRRAHTVNNMQLAPEAALTEAEKQLRVRYDRDLTATGAALDLELQMTERRLSEAIAAAEELPREEAPVVGVGDRLLAEHVALLSEDRIAARLNGKTRAQVLERYRQASADTLEGRATLRFVERQMRTGWEDVTLKDDRDHDAAVLLELQKLVTERRRSRVPSWMFEARSRAQAVRAKAAFSGLLAHLRSGRGIATVKR